MCGISGILSINLSEGQINESVEKMIFSQNHRGPDNHGKLKISDNIYFGHNRLSILDLTPNGNQPMLSYNKNHVII